MTYNKKLYAKIGKQLVEKHPDVALQILQQFPQPLDSDLTKIEHHFNTFCLWSNVEPDNLRGAVYTSRLTEARKVFISAMVKIYSDQYQFQKCLTQVLSLRHSAISETVCEVRVRYAKDIPFTDRVDNFFNTIIHN